MPSTEDILTRRCSMSSDSSESNSVEGMLIYDCKSIGVRTPTSSESSSTSSGDDKENSSGFGSENDGKSEEQIAEQQNKLIKLLEFYLSDENLEKDAFLLKHIVRNKEGYVSLKLLASFRKIRSITRDWQVVLRCIQNTENQLVLNEEETKVRRKVQYSGPTDVLKKKTATKTTEKKKVEVAESKTETAESDNKMTRCVIASNLSSAGNSIAAVAELFSQCGTVVSVRIIKPDEEIPVDMKPYLSKICSNNCALVEYGTVDEANQAVAKLGGTKSNDWRSMNVFPVVSKKDSNNNVNSKDKINNKSNRMLKTEPQTQQKPVEQGARRTKAISVSEHESISEDGKPASLSAYRRKHPMPTVTDSRRRCITLCCNDYPISESSSNSSSEGSWRTKSMSACESSEPHVRPRSESSPWVQRRLQAAKESGNSLPTVRRTDGSLPDNVIRLPRGPDGTRGFHPRNANPVSTENSIPIRV